MMWFWFLLAMACLPPPPPADTSTVAVQGQCEANPLECPSCTYADDLANSDGILRVYHCETDDGVRLDAIRRTDPSSQHDTHFYDEAGGRVAAQRLYDENPGECRDVDDEWWGQVLVCDAVCEIARHAESDDTLPDC